MGLSHSINVAWISGTEATAMEHGTGPPVQMARNLARVPLERPATAGVSTLVAGRTMGIRRRIGARKGRTGVGFGARQGYVKEGRVDYWQQQNCCYLMLSLWLQRSPLDPQRLAPAKGLAQIQVGTILLLSSPSYQDP